MSADFVRVAPAAVPGQQTCVGEPFPIALRCETPAADLRAVTAWVAANRYALSKCRGGACRPSRQTDLHRAPLGPLWTCHSLGMLARGTNADARSQNPTVVAKLGYLAPSRPALPGSEQAFLLHRGSLISPSRRPMGRAGLRRFRRVPQLTAEKLLRPQRQS